MKAADLDTALKDNLTEEKLAPYFTVRGYALTEKAELHSIITQKCLQNTQ